MNALTVANYMLYLMNDIFDDLTNMKINKLLYFTQGHYLQTHNEPLFYEDIEAWEHGPVVPDVYLSYKKYGSNPITSYDETLITQVPSKVKEIIHNIAVKYGKYTAGELRNLTHEEGTPWSQVYHADIYHVVIPVNTIKNYFRGIDNLSPLNIPHKESDFIGYRDKDGFLVLPKEWDDEAV